MKNTITPTTDPTAPISISAGAAAVKHRKLTSGEFKSAKASAIAATGYDKTSPIWGKKVEEVADLVIDKISVGSYGDAINLLNELKRRALTRKLTFGR